MGNMANIKEFVDCCFCTHRDLKASHLFNNDDENQGDSEIKCKNLESDNPKDSSFSDTDFPSQREIEEFNEKFEKKFEHYRQIPKTSVILYKSGIIE